MSNSQNKNKTAVIIPLFNEEETIFDLIKQLLDKPIDKIFVIDDGCTDSSVSKIPQNSKVEIIPHAKNLGKGITLKTGFLKAIEGNYNYVVTLDADLQHDPESVSGFINKLNECDVVLGNRMNDLEDMPIHRRLSNKITSKMLSIKTGKHFIDSQCGYRAFRTSILSNILPSSAGFEAETEMLIKAAKLNLKIGNVNIPTIYNDNKSKIKPVRTIFSFLRVIFVN